MNWLALQIARAVAPVDVIKPAASAQASTHSYAAPPTCSGDCYTRCTRSRSMLLTNNGKVTDLLGRW